MQSLLGSWSQKKKRRKKIIIKKTLYIMLTDANYIEDYVINMIMIWELNVCHNH